MCVKKTGLQLEDEASKNWVEDFNNASHGPASQRLQTGWVKLLLAQERIYFLLFILDRCIGCQERIPVHYY